MQQTAENKYIICHQEGRTTHWYLVEDGKQKPISDKQVKFLRYSGVPVDMPETKLIQKD